MSVDWEQIAGQYDLEREKAEAERDNLLEKVKKLEEKVSEQVTEIEDLKDEKEWIESDMEGIRGELDQLKNALGLERVIVWALEAGADPFAPEARLSPDVRVRVQEIQQRRGWACASYEQKGKLEICKCGKGMREHARELV